MFSKINLTDDPEVASNDDNFIKNLGSIKIAALRGTETGPVYKSNQFDEVSDNRVSLILQSSRAQVRQLLEIPRLLMNARRKLAYLIKSGESTVFHFEDHTISAETSL